METNLDNMEANLNEADKIKEYATQCMIEIMDNKTQK